MRRHRPFRHRCAAPGCELLVPHLQLMCQPHWDLVPRELQIAVYTNYVDGPKSRAWTQAVSAAIAAVTKQGELFA